MDEYYNCVCMKKYLNRWLYYASNNINIKSKKDELCLYLDNIYLTHLLIKNFKHWHYYCESLRYRRMSDEFYNYYQKHRAIKSLIINANKYRKYYQILLRRWFKLAYNTNKIVNSLYCHIIIRRWKNNIIKIKNNREKLNNMCKIISKKIYKLYINKWKDYKIYLCYVDELNEKYEIIRNNINFNLLYKIFHQWIIYHQMIQNKMIEYEKAVDFNNMKILKKVIRLWYRALALSDTRKRYELNLVVYINIFRINVLKNGKHIQQNNIYMIYNVF